MGNLDPVHMRETVIRAMRGYFYEHGFHEVIVPVLNRSVPHEANLHPFQAGKYYLSLSPERGLKRMIAKGEGNCFAIAKSFRNLEASGPQHMAEFLMLEWYRENSGLTEIMDETERIVTAVSGAVSRRGKTVPDFSRRTVSLQDMFMRYVGCGLHEVLSDETRMFAVASGKGYSTEGASWRGLWDQLFVNEIEPHLDKGAVFLTDFPSRVSPLCKPKDGDPLIAARFELYLDGIEIANGNTENTDASAIRRALENEPPAGKKIPGDEAFFQAVDGLKGRGFSGCGSGVDRLTMVLGGYETVRSVEQLFEG